MIELKHPQQQEMEGRLHVTRELTDMTGHADTCLHL